MVKRFLRSGRTGFYLAVTREGEVRAGDASPDRRPELAISVPRSSACIQRRREPESSAQGSELSGFRGWRDYFRKRLWEPDA